MLAQPERGGRRAKILRLRRAQQLETEGLRASQPVSKKLGPNPALSFQRLVSKAQLLTVCELADTALLWTRYFTIPGPDIAGYNEI